MANKLIDDAELSLFTTYFKLWIASNFVSRITYSTLPTENNYVGRKIFLSTDEHEYTYTNSGWRKIPYADELLFNSDDNGNVIMK